MGKSAEAASDILPCTKPQQYLARKPTIGEPALTAFPEMSNAPGGQLVLHDAVEKATKHRSGNPCWNKRRAKMASQFTQETKRFVASRSANGLLRLDLRLCSL